MLTRTRFFAFLLLALGLSLWGQPAAAQWSTVAGQPTPVSAGHAAPFFEQYPLSATLPDGRRYVAWVENQSVGSQNSEIPYTVRLQLFGADGRKQWAPEGLAVYTAPVPAFVNGATLISTFQGYDLQVDAAGNAVLAYSNLSYTDSNDGEIRAQKVSPAGQAQWGAAGGVLVQGPVLNTPNPKRRNMHPVLALTPAGDALITWALDTYSVTLQKLAAGTGQSQWSAAPLLLDPTYALNYATPTVVSDGGAGAILVYFQYASAGLNPPGALLAQHYDGSGAPQWAAPVAVSSLAARYPAFPQLHAQVVPDTAGGCYVAFNTPGPAAAPTAYGSYVQHLDAAGTPWSATGTAVAVANPAAWRLAALRYVAARQETWLLLGTPPSDAASSGAYVQKLDASGAVQLGSVALAVAAPAAAHPLAQDLRDTQDGLLVLYSEDVPVAGQTTANQLLRVAKIDYAAQPAWAAPVLLAPAGLPKVYAALSDYATGNVVATWQDNSGNAFTGSQVLAQGLSRTGQLGAYVPLAARPAAAALQASLYPNPAAQAAVHLTLAAAATVRLDVLDALGRAVATRTEAAPAGLLTLALPAAAAAGMYLVRVQVGSTSRTLRWSRP